MPKKQAVNTRKAAAVAAAVPNSTARNKDLPTVLEGNKVGEEEQESKTNSGKSEKTRTQAVAAPVPPAPTTMSTTVVPTSTPPSSKISSEEIFFTSEEQEQGFRKLVAERVEELMGKYDEEAKQEFKKNVEKMPWHARVRGWEKTIFDLQALNSSQKEDDTFYKNLYCTLLPHVCTTHSSSTYETNLYIWIHHDANCTLIPFVF